MLRTTWSLPGDLARLFMIIFLSQVLNLTIASQRGSIRPLWGDISVKDGSDCQLLGGAASNYSRTYCMKFGKRLCGTFGFF